MAPSLENAAFHASAAADLARTLLRSGIVSPEGGLKPALANPVLLARYRFTTTRELEQGARSCPDRIALIDDHGTLSYQQLRNHSRTFAQYLQRTHGNGVRLGIMCRNGRAPIIALGAKGYTDTTVFMLNIGSSAQQLRATMEENHINVLVIDSEFAPRVPTDYPTPVDVIIGHHAGPTDHLTLEKIANSARQYRDEKLPLIPNLGKVVLMSSGTTGTPKGIVRDEPKIPYILTSAMERMPWRANQRVLLTASIFHTWGWGCLNVALGARNTIITHRVFDPEQSLEDLQRYAIDGMISSPVMYKQMVAADPRRQYNTSTLKFIASSGHALDPELVRTTNERFGEILHNFYGSTEISLAAVASNEDLAKDPTVAGRIASGTRIKILDEHHNEVPTGEIGEIYLRNGMTMTGYTRPGMEVEYVDGMVSIGDYGYLDAGGLLHVCGRVDDMIIVGGENVHPQSVSSVLEALPGIKEVHAGGVSDEQSFERIAVWVVRTNDAAGKALDAHTIQDFVRERLADHSIPRDVHFLDKLPRNATGKVVPRLL
ncbi:acyl-CoA synthetase [Corynebacterium phocae]|uniref:Acyl-CoA synthetase n=1 Tax=Corynebacterium phocae TaxID=161895 RepID=A0A1L7D1D1_9CORY|nr:AMP-binding protein [Corynebacterium phocae]APT91771.1 acyl-CoA synthetase [Corynebacterium phocae]KAA8728542.1 AMP-binding protein [Corynebacterium phocae]